MAEAGANKGDNPFSFKKFVKKETRPGENAESAADNDIDIFDLPDTIKQRKRDKQKQILVVEEELPKVKQKKKGKSENPFSFKKFLSGPGSDGKPPAGSASKIQDDSGTALRSEGLCLSNPSELPDFVQDHYSDIPAGAATGFLIPKANNTQQVSPDIGDTNLVSRLAGNVGDEHRTLSDNDDDFSDEEDEHKTHKHNSRIHSLPDFLSDAALGSRGNSEGGPDVYDSGGEEFGGDQDVWAQRLRKLQEENASLKRQMEEMKSSSAHDAESLASMQQQLVLQKKKEEEETAVMERAMEQVEKNLSDTTQRAVQAETVVTKLKQEVKALQAEVKSLRTENSVLRSGDQYVLDIKERTSYVAEQLSTASKTAETSLRQLLTGVDNLKLLSQVLSSIDKITEEKPSPEGQHNLPGEKT